MWRVILLLIFLVGCQQVTVQPEVAQVTGNVDSQVDLGSQPEVACPRGLVHDTMPRCGLYENSDQNEFCDLSEVN